MEDDTSSPHLASSEPTEYEKLRNSEADKREERKIRIENVKALGTIMIPIVLFLANCQLQERAKIRDAELDRIAKVREARKIALEMQNSREASEAQMKANMFAKLLEQYQSKAIAVDPQQKLFFLELLVSNFGDSLNLSPIINDVLVDARAASQLSDDVVNRIAKALREAAAKQVSMLRNAPTALVYNIDLDINKQESFEILHCEDGKPDPTQDRIHITLNSLDQDKKIKDLQIANLTLKYDDITGANPYIQQISIDSTDLPLIDNTPMRNGYRFSILVNPSDDKNNKRFRLIFFPQELTSIRDRPNARDFLRFLDFSVNPDSSVVDKSVACEKSLGDSLISIKEL